jgi:hypothetical protein
VGSTVAWESVSPCVIVVRPGLVQDWGRSGEVWVSDLKWSRDP